MNSRRCCCRALKSMLEDFGSTIVNVRPLPSTKKAKKNPHWRNPMKVFSTMLAITAIFCAPQLLKAHDGWVEVAPAIVEKNQPATISLIQGNHANEHKSDRIAGKWDPKYT